MSILVKGIVFSFVCVFMLFSLLLCRPPIIQFLLFSPGSSTQSHRREYLPPILVRFFFLVLSLFFPPQFTLVSFFRVVERGCAHGHVFPFCVVLRVCPYLTLCSPSNPPPPRILSFPPSAGPDFASLL